MSATSPRSGSPVDATVTTAGTPGSTAREVAFGTYASPALVTNLSTTQDLYLKINDSGASPTDFHIKLSPEQAVEASFEGLLRVGTISVYLGSGDYATDVNIVGWQP